MLGLHRFKRRLALISGLFVLVVGASLLSVHYAGYDVVSRYPIDGVLTSCRSEGFFAKTVQLEMTADGTGKSLSFTVPADGQELDEFARAAGQGARIRVYSERRAVWLPWEGSTRRATGVDWLGSIGRPSAIDDGRPEKQGPEGLAPDLPR
jgi:hypothetical protein